MTTLLLASDTLLTIAVATAAVTGVSIVILETALWIKRRRARAADVAPFGSGARPMSPTEEAARSARREATRRRGSRPVPQSPAPSAKATPVQAAAEKPATTRKVKTEPSRAASAPRAASTAGAVVPKAFSKQEDAPSRPLVSDMPIVSAAPVAERRVVDTVDDADAYDFTHRARSYRPAAVRHEPSGLVDSVAIPVVPQPLIVGQGDESEEELAALAVAAQERIAEETRKIEKVAAEAAIAARRAEQTKSESEVIAVPEIRAGVGALSTRKSMVDDVQDDVETEETIENQSALAAAAFMEMRAGLVDDDALEGDSEEIVHASHEMVEVSEGDDESEDDESEDEGRDVSAASSPMTGLTDLVEQGLAGVSSALQSGNVDEDTVSGLEETLEELVRLTDNALLPSASATLRLVPEPAEPEEEQAPESIGVQDQPMAEPAKAPVRVFDSLRIDRVSLESEETPEDEVEQAASAPDSVEAGDGAEEQAEVERDFDSSQAPLLLDGSVVEDEAPIARPSDSMVHAAVAAEIPTEDLTLGSLDDSESDETAGTDSLSAQAEEVESHDNTEAVEVPARSGIRPIPYASSSRVPVPPRDPDDPESFDLIQLGRRSAALRRVIVEEEARESARSPRVVDESVYDLHRQPLRIVRSDSNPALRMRESSESSQESAVTEAAADAPEVPTSQRIDLSVPVEIADEEAVVDAASMDAPVVEMEEPVVEDVKVMVPADLLEPGMGEDPDENPRPRGRSRRTRQ